MTIILRGGKWNSPQEMKDALKDFKGQNMDFVILQTVEDGLSFNARSALSGDWLEETIIRLHWFGEGGDLTVRRDGNVFYWRYVSEDTTGDSLYGELYPANLVANTELQQAMLWGRYQGKPDDVHTWQEDIVGKAELTYPYPADDIDDKHTHIKIYAKAVLHDGQPIAYWTTHLETVTED